MSRRRNEWSRRWPDKPGSYWFYGWPYGSRANFDGSPIPPELNHVKVMKCSNGLLVVRDGSFWSRSEGGVGLFSRVDLPDLPDLAVLSEKGVKP